MWSNKLDVITWNASTIASKGVSPPAKSAFPCAAGCSVSVDCGNDVSLVIATVPDLLGIVIVLSAVGSVTPNVVSKLSAVEPSNTMLPPTVKLVTLGLASKAIEISLFETVVVSANDTLVQLFLENKIKFIDIQKKLFKIINNKQFIKYKNKSPKTIRDIVELNNYVRLKTLENNI